MKKFALKLFSLSGFAVLFMASSCEVPLSFEVLQRGQTQVQRCPLGVEVLSSLGFSDLAEMDFENTQEFANQGVTKEDVTSVRLRSARVTIAMPAESDFSYLDRLAFYAEAEGLPRVLIAEATSFPEGEATIDFRALDVELQPYVVAEHMSITTEVDSNGCPRTDQTVDVEVKFEVRATVNGLGRYAEQSIQR